jgi:hypothetical protein
MILNIVTLIAFIGIALSVQTDNSPTLISEHIPRMVEWITSHGGFVNEKRLGMELNDLLFLFYSTQSRFIHPIVELEFA